MLELQGLNALREAGTNDPDDLAPGDKRVIAILTIIYVVVYLVLLVFAILRAIKCSTATPDSRALHLMFAIVSPVMYLIFSYLVPGMCRRT